MFKGAEFVSARSISAMKPFCVLYLTNELILFTLTCKKNSGTYLKYKRTRLVLKCLNRINARIDL